MSLRCVTCGTTDGTVQCQRCPRSVCKRHLVVASGEILCPRCARLELEDFKDE